MKNKFNPLISIIIPVYNGENYLNEAINSALKQTYQNKEIIVVNDGSTDNTEKIIKKYKNKIKYYKKKNGGVATALNLAIKNMSGEYFSWLSHDDLYVSDKLEKQVEFLKTQKNRNIVLYTDYNIINEKGLVTSIAQKNHEDLLKKPEYSLLRGNVNGITMLIPKKCFEDCGLFNESLKCTQDYDLWRKIQKKYPFIHLPIVTASTRIHSMQDSQISPKAISEGNKLWIEMVEDIDDKRKEELEGSVYNYYAKTAEFLKLTPYDKAYDYFKNLALITKNNSLINRKENLVSVIIPFFNRVDLLINSIKSVLQSSFKNYEIILIDDCSTDSLDSLFEFIKGNTKIKYYKNKQNMGPAYSRNVGIEKSNGNYIAFLDSDDEFMPNKIMIQLSEMILNNAKASYTNYYAVKKDEINAINSFTKNDINHNEFIDNCKLATPTIMIKKDFLMENNIRYNVKYKVCEDCCFYLEILKKTDFLFVDNYLTKVNIFSTTSINNIDKRLTGIKNIINYITNDEIYCMNILELEFLLNGYKYILDPNKTNRVLTDNYNNLVNKVKELTNENYVLSQNNNLLIEKNNNMEIEINNLTKQVHYLNNKIIDIYNCNSMKLTAFLRKIRAFFAR